jgi:hypothetical protein
MSLLFLGLFFASVFGASLVNPVASVARWNDIRIGLPHIYSAVLVSACAVFFYLTMTSPFSFQWWVVGGLVGVAVLCRRFLWGVDEAHWLRYAIQEQSQSLLVSLHTMDATKTDKVRALTHKAATGAEDALKLLHHFETTADVTKGKETK